MAIFKLSLSLVLLALHVVQGNAKSTSAAESYLLEDLNGYRMSLHIQNFTENSNAACLANKIADQLQNETCKNAFHFSSTPGTKPKVPKFDKFLDDCDINDNNTVDGVILPVCVPRLDPFLVFSNYTKSRYAKYLKDSNYTGVGIGSEDIWMVVILSTNTSTGSFSGAASLIANISMGNYTLALFLGLLLLFW
ncbi:putative GPI-anchored protein At5g19250 isoform X2 [Castanea sativa]|uniref:putative GPI-anchored protein At5g19250 isoform X2 n=1 Tax=Castanea sativa TaxID=21020 RepID=UPI003F6546D4